MKQYMLVYWKHGERNIHFFTAANEQEAKKEVQTFMANYHISKDSAAFYQVAAISL